MSFFNSIFRVNTNKIPVFVIIVLAIYRLFNITENEISWDVLGYYLPLPALFIYNDFLLTDITWLQELNYEKNLAGTLYMISELNSGKTIYFFLFGSSIFYLPFFFVGHIFASIFGFEANGFSSPYQISLVIGGIFYASVGLIYFYRNLNLFLNKNISILTFIIVVFGTNYIHHLTLKNLEPLTFLFLLCNVILYYTIRWHNTQKLKYIVLISVSFGLIALTKPSEIFVFIIPLISCVYDYDSFRKKVELILTNKYQILVGLLISLLIVTPQFIYWYYSTGNLIYDSYNNPGVGLDFSNPHISEVLFSFRKGWLLYTPIMFFSLIGFYFLYKYKREYFYSFSLYFLISFYIIASWTEWWYGAGFSIRPMITLYPILAINLGIFIHWLGKIKFKSLKIVFFILVTFFIALNQFQWWQFKQWIIHPYLTTKSYYFDSFFKTNPLDVNKDLLLVERDFSGKMEFKNKLNYEEKMHLFLKDTISIIENSYIKFNETNEFLITKSFPYDKISNQDHFWVVVNFNYKINCDSNYQKPVFVATMERLNGNYGYFSKEVSDCNNSDWSTFQFEYLTPPIRSESDILKIYFWNRSKSVGEIKNYEIKIFERKNNVP